MISLPVVSRKYPLPPRRTLLIKIHYKFDRCKICSHTLSKNCVSYILEVKNFVSKNVMILNIIFENVRIGLLSINIVKIFWKLLH